MHLNVVRVAGILVVSAGASLDAQITEIEAERVTSAIACSDDGCDVPPTQQSAAFGPIAHTRSATAFDFFTYTEAFACADQTSDIPPGGPYEGFLIASGTATNDFGAGQTDFLSDSLFRVRFSIDAACSLRVQGDYDLTELDGVAFGGPAQVAASVAIDVAGATNASVLDRSGNSFSTFETTIELAPGTHDLIVHVIGSAAVNNLTGSASSIASCNFVATLDCGGGPACLCELGGDPEEVDVQDLLIYLDAWLSQAPSADLDGGGVSIVDLLLYLDCYFDVVLGGPC